MPDDITIQLWKRNIHAREAFRHHSFVSARADAVIAGLGIEGYEAAIRRICGLLTTA